MKRLLLLLILAACCVGLPAQSLFDFGLDAGYTTDKMVVKWNGTNDEEVSNTVNYRGFYAAGLCRYRFVVAGLQFRYQTLFAEDDATTLAGNAPDKQMFLELPVTTSELGIPILDFFDLFYMSTSLNLGLLPSYCLSGSPEGVNKFDVKLLGGISLDFVDIGGAGSVSFGVMIRRGVLDLDKSDLTKTKTNGLCYGLTVLLDLNSL